MNYGFIEPVITEDNYVYGDNRIGAVEPVLEEDQDWGEWDFISDVQIKGFDTLNCTGFNTAQSVSKTIWRKFGIKFKPSPRWIGIIAGTDPKKGGNDPHTVCEAIRKYGLVSDEMLPWSDDIKTVEEYYSFKGADEKECRAEAKNWKNQYDFKHDWVFKPNEDMAVKKQKIKETLKYSPQGVAVYAWAQNDKGEYIRLGKDTHWTEIRAVRGNREVIDDSYKPFEKELVEDFDLFYAKRYVINKAVPRKNWLLDLIERLYQFITGK